MELQVVRYNDLVNTNPAIHMDIEEFVNVVGEDVVHDAVEEDLPAIEEGPSQIEEAGQVIEEVVAELEEEEDDDIEQVEIDVSRKRVFQLMNELETCLQHHDVGAEVKDKVTLAFSDLQDKLQRDHLAKLKQKSIMSYFTRNE